MSKKLLAYLRLMRISNLPTAWSNILVGFLIVSGSWQPPLALLLLLATSSCLYLAGMIMNDLVDIEFDRQLQPHRVLPSGQIDVVKARSVGMGLGLAGLLFSSYFLTGSVIPNLPFRGGLPLMTAACLAVCVVAYNSWAKRTALGPLLMGGCRFFNVLLGGSLVAAKPDLILGYDPFCFFAAVGIGIYVSGLTWFARKEHADSGRGGLILGSGLMACGIGLLCWLANSTNYLSRAVEMNDQQQRSVQLVFSGLLLIMVFPVIRRVITAIATPNTHNVKRAVVVSLLTLIMIDASLCYLVAPTNLFYCFVTAALVCPSYFLSRIINAT